MSISIKLNGIVDIRELISSFKRYCTSDVGSHKTHVQKKWGQVLRAAWPFETFEVGSFKSIFGVIPVLGIW